MKNVILFSLMMGLIFTSCEKQGTEFIAEAPLEDDYIVIECAQLDVLEIVVDSIKMFGIDSSNLVTFGGNFYIDGNLFLRLYFEYEGVINGEIAEGVFDLKQMYFRMYDYVNVGDMEPYFMTGSLNDGSQIGTITITQVGDIGNIDVQGTFDINAPLLYIDDTYDLPEDLFYEYTGSFSIANVK